ncbi:hypothetical protein OEA41_007439 [Lepraria neglecta]|uniref:Uncharacterized protein n=1 Tax=Lepraria neglecta TaxID=209136 RepID=A0AAD9ZD41_9LECA|nr:hypothetical protein OEA41_007439 [Lepraria neglecta]
MLLTSRLGSLPAGLALLILFALPALFYFRVPQLERLKLSSITSLFSNSLLRDNSYLIEQDGLFDVQMEGGPRIRQATMLFGTDRDRGENVMYERATKTRLRHDWNGFNCGVFFLRVNEWSVNLLTAATALRLLRPELNMVQRGPNYEQDAMVWVLEQQEHLKHVIYQPREWFNLFELHHDQNTLKYKPGDLLMHAVGAQDKYQAMGHWLDRLDNSPEELQLQLSNISLKGDVDRFWSILKDADNLLDMAKTFRQEADIKKAF